MIKSLAVVYLGGSCGQFVRQLLLSVICKTYTDFQFSRNGSAHFLGSDGSDRWSLPSTITSTQTHSFVSIPELLSKYDKVVAITVTPNSHEEYIIRTTNVLMKLHLEDRKVNVDTTQLKLDIANYLGPEYSDFASHIYDMRYDLDHKEICLYFLYRYMFDDKSQYLFDMEKTWYGQGNIDGCIELPFNVIRYGDTKAFTNFVEKVVDDPLSDKEKQYVETIFNRYYNAQDKLLYNSPYEYLKITQEQGLGKLETFKRRYYQSTLQ